MSDGLPGCDGNAYPTVVPVIAGVPICPDDESALDDWRCPECGSSYQERMGIAYLLREKS